jgi:hypothetical protein
MWPRPYCYNEYLSPFQMPTWICHTQDCLPAPVLPRPKKEDFCNMDVNDTGTQDELDIAGCW